MSAYYNYKFGYWFRIIFFKGNQGLWYWRIFGSENFSYKIEKNVSLQFVVSLILFTKGCIVQSLVEIIKVVQEKEGF